MEVIVFIIVIGVICIPVVGVICIFKINSRLKKMQSGLNLDLCEITNAIARMDMQIHSIRKIVEKDIPQEVKEYEESHVEPELEPELELEEKEVEEILFVEEEPEVVMPTTPVEVRELRERAPREKTKFEETVGDILKRIWSWILVGEDYRPKNVSMEYAVASTWLMRLGIIALVVCIGYFLKWTIDQGLLGPDGRIALSVLAGITMLGVGIRNLQKKYHILAQGFIGGGLAALYFSIYAAGLMYYRISLPASFILMILVTIVAGVLALRANSQLIAIFSIIGGFWTPIILKIPAAGLMVLYSYLLLLSIGIFGIAHVKNWRLLNYLGFVFTWLIFSQGLSIYVPARDFVTTITFLSLLFILHSVIVYYYNLIKCKKSTALEITHLSFNSFLYAMTSYWLIIQAHDRPWPAVMAVGLGIFYIIHVFVFLKKRFNDRNLLIVLIGIAGFFTVWAVPLITEKETLTICWALQAFFFLWMGLKMNSNLLVTLSSILYFLVMGRFTFLDMPGNFANYSWDNVPMIEYWKVFFDRIWTLGMVIATFFGGFVLHKHKIKQISAFAVDESSNTKLLISKSVFREIMFWCGVVSFFFVMYFELFQMFYYCLPLQMPILTMLWYGLGVYLIYNFTSKRKNIFLFVSIVIMLIILGKLFIFDFDTWGFIHAVYVYEIGTINMLMRFLDYGFIFLFLMALMKATHGKDDPINYGRVFTIASTVLLFVYVSLETNTFFHWYILEFQEGSISVAWAIFAIAYLIIGIRKLSKAWRYSGLILFLVVVGKVFFIDMSDMEIVHRVIAFMILGILLIGGAFAYIKANKKFEIKEDAK
ncbi:MAG: DUF2339 domain-containing protein [bacterium]|nr:DUF2339 domain-containing protein [bacterium]